MDTWEYTHVKQDLSSFEQRVEHENWLGVMGRKGWELVSVNIIQQGNATTAWLYFKRRT